MANVLNTNDIIIGSGRLYIDGENVGQLKDEVSMVHGKEYYECKAGFPASVVLEILSEETMTLNVSLLEANLPILRSFIDEYTAYTETAGTANITDESVTVTAGVWASLAHSNISAITVTDTATEPATLVLGTDYTLDTINGRITRVSTSSTIADGDTVVVAYTYVTATASGFGMGGASTESTTHLVEFVHPRRDSKYRVVKLWTAKLGGDFTLSFQEAAESPVTLEIEALADSSKSAGQQFGLVFDTTTAPYGNF
jgi:hypothetical protein